MPQFSIEQVFLLVSVLLLLLLIFLASKYLLTYFELFKEEYVLLELLPPAKTEKTSYTTQQLFALIHGLGQQKSIFHRFLRVSPVFSFEIFSTYSGGIKYVLRIKKKSVESIKRIILSYLPYARVTEIQDYILDREHTNHLLHKIIEFRQNRHFAYSLEKQDTLEEHDPVAYLTGMMTKLNPSELISLQLTLQPIVSSQAFSIRSKILAGRSLADIFPTSSNNFLHSLASTLQWSINTLISDLSSPYRASAIKSQYVSKQTNPFEQTLIAKIKNKVDQPLFDTRVRCLFIMKDSDSIESRIQGMSSAFAIYSSHYQALRRHISILESVLHKYRYLSFIFRTPSLLSTSRNILSVSEVSDLYHFPFTQVTQTENIVKVHSKKLPAPLSLKQHNNFDITFARNSYAGVDTLIGLSADERARHMYILGATGSGKSTLLLSMIEQDIKNGKTICVIDPHGDLALSALDCVPPSRIQDVVYLNPFDIAYPIGINLLQTTKGLSEDEKLLEQEFVTESVVSLFRKVFSEGSTGHPHRIEYILRNTIHTAFTVESPTLFTIFDLLNDPGYQKEIVSKLTDEHLLNFWKHEFGKAGDYQKVKMVSPVTARIGRFLFSPSARRVLEQKESTIDFDHILEQNKIFICNLSKGNIGEDTSEVMGVMILNKLQLALLKRARKEQTERKQFYLYVDEFQNFATPSFVQMLSESRKYGLHLTIAEQSTSQQDDRNMVHTILANVGNVVAFRSANPQDEDLLLRQFSPYILRGDIANLPAFNFYMKTSALSPEEPFSGETVVPSISVDYDKRTAIVNSSRYRYARPYEKAPVELKQVRKPKTKKSKNEQISPSVVVQSVFPEDM